MGARPSRVCHEYAQQAYDEAQRLSREHALPRPRGAILAYLNGRMDARQVWSECTYLELNEFARLEPPGLEEWYDRHQHERACGPSTRHCILPLGRVHYSTCPHFRMLPADIALGFGFSDSSSFNIDGEDDGRSEWSEWSESYDDSIEGPPRHHRGRQSHYGGAFGPSDRGRDDDELTDSTISDFERWNGNISPARGDPHGNPYGSPLGMPGYHWPRRA